MVAPPPLPARNANFMPLEENPDPRLYCAIDDIEDHQIQQPGDREVDISQSEHSYSEPPATPTQVDNCIIQEQQPHQQPSAAIRAVSLDVDMEEDTADINGNCSKSFDGEATISVTDNSAYGANIAIAPDVETEENIAYCSHAHADSSDEETVVTIIDVTYNYNSA